MVCSWQVGDSAEPEVYFFEGLSIRRALGVYKSHLKQEERKQMLLSPFYSIQALRGLDLPIWLGRAICFTKSTYSKS